MPINRFNYLHNSFFGKNSHYSNSAFYCKVLIQSISNSFFHLYVKTVLFKTKLLKTKNYYICKKQNKRLIWCVYSSQYIFLNKTQNHSPLLIVLTHLFYNKQRCCYIHLSDYYAIDFFLLNIQHNNKIFQAPFSRKWSKRSLSSSRTRSPP